MADSPVAVAFAHVNEPPTAPSAIDPTLPPELDVIVMRAMAKDPALRYQTAVEFRADVERAIAGVPVTRVMPAPVLFPDSQATTVMSGVDPDATVVAAGAAAATGAMAPVVPGGAGSPPPPPDRSDLEPEAASGGGFWKKLGLTVLVIAVAGAIFWLASSLLASTATKTVEVPRLEGLTAAQAETTLRAAGLRLGGPDFVASDLPKDSVISQDPRVRRTRRVGQHGLTS